MSREKADEYVKKQMAEYQHKWGSLEAYIENVNHSIMDSGTENKI